MNVDFKNGRVVTECILCDEIPYDVSNNAISVQFNGQSGINFYQKINDLVAFEGLSTFKFFINDHEISFDTPKSVENIGRTQTVVYHTATAEIKTVSVLDQRAQAVITKLEVRPTERISLELAIVMWSAVSKKCERREDGSFYYGDTGFSFASDADFVCEAENDALFYHMDPFDKTQSFHIVYGFSADNLLAVLQNADRYIQQAFYEIDAIKLPSDVVTQRDRALYYAAHFCALQNYKEIGAFKGFMAGCKYVIPARTYFRDAYFTVLSMYNGHRDKVRNEILTLSRGIDEDGNCPSAVKYDFSSFWGRHFDSPSLYILMVYDYVNNTGDLSVLSEKVGAYTVLELMERVLDQLSRFCDETGLLVKQGPYNRRDWADEVNRYGYVTYDEILYARALYGFARLLTAAGETQQAVHYDQQFLKVKQSIHRYLWMEDKGYYVNYTDGNFVEDNLSIDTVLAVIFEITDPKQSVRLLENCMRQLDSRNHTALEPFGTLSVYPLYKDIHATVNKSARPFDYHNGAEWPYWSALFAYALKKYGFAYEFPLKNWFFYNLDRGNFTPIEYFSPYCKDGSLLQAWSSVAAFVYDDVHQTFFKNKL